MTTRANYLPISNASNSAPPPSSSSAARCAVCGAPHHGTHFGILSCRACASFFRRTNTERKRYACRRHNDCDIRRDGMRNACRACRLRRCLRAGMSAGSADEPVGDGSSPVQPSTSTADCQCVDGAITKITFTLSGECPILDKYIAGLHTFISGQRSVVIMEHPQRIFSDQQYRIESQTEFLRLERSSITLLNTLIASYFPGVRVLSPGQRMELLKNYAPVFFYLLRCHLTIRAFPNVDRIVTHANCYIDRRSIDEHFFRDDLPDREQHVRFSLEIIQRAGDRIAQFKTLNVTEREVVALGVHFFAQAASNSKLDILNLNEMRDRSLVELHADCLRRFGQDAPIRLGRLFTLAEDILSQVNEIKESITVAKIFLTHIPDVWEECDVMAACI